MSNRAKMRLPQRDILSVKAADADQYAAMAAYQLALLDAVDGRGTVADATTAFYAWLDAFKAFYEVNVRFETKLFSDRLGVLLDAMDGAQ